MVGADPAEVAMIGDDIESDVAGAQAAGLRGILVRTGKFSPEDLERGITPDMSAENFAEAVERLIRTPL
jgi:ribonucleotide monophosphatase NagD (HAD superfamily)